MDNQILSGDDALLKTHLSDLRRSRIAPKRHRSIGQIVSEQRGGNTRHRISFGLIEGRRIQVSRLNGGRCFQSRSDAEAALEQIRGLIRATGLTPRQAIERVVGRQIWSKPTFVERDWHRRYQKEMLRGAKTRAKARGLEFSITIEDIPIPARCPVFDIELRPTIRTGSRAKGRHAPSLDRIDPRRGYVPGNVIVISWRANHLKSNATADELRKLVEWLAYLNANHTPRPPAR